MTKIDSYSELPMSTSTKVLGYENDSPKTTNIYSVPSTLVPFIPTNAKQFIGRIAQGGPSFGPTLIPMSGTINQIGLPVNSVRNSAGDYYLEFTANKFQTGVLYMFLGPSSAEVNPVLTQMSLDPADPNYSKIKITNYDVNTGTLVDGMNYSLWMIYMP